MTEMNAQKAALTEKLGVAESGIKAARQCLEEPLGSRDAMATLERTLQRISGKG